MPWLYHPFLWNDLENLISIVKATKRSSWLHPIFSGVGRGLVTWPKESSKPVTASIWKLLDSWESVHWLLPPHHYRKLHLVCWGPPNCTQCVRGVPKLYTVCQGVPKLHIVCQEYPQTVHSGVRGSPNCTVCQGKPNCTQCVRNIPKWYTVCQEGSLNCTQCVRRIPKL